MPSLAVAEERRRLTIDQLVGRVAAHGREGLVDEAEAALQRDQGGVWIDLSVGLVSEGRGRPLHYVAHDIGLATCRRRVERHGGRTWVEDTASGEGSRFCFALARDGVAPGVDAA